MTVFDRYLKPSKIIQLKLTKKKKNALFIAEMQVINWVK